MGGEKQLALQEVWISYCMYLLSYRNRGGGIVCSAISQQSHSSLKWSSPSQSKTTITTTCRARNSKSSPLLTLGLTVTSAAAPPMTDGSRSHNGWMERWMGCCCCGRALDVAPVVPFLLFPDIAPPHQRCHIKLRLPRNALFPSAKDRQPYRPTLQPRLPCQPRPP